MIERVALDASPRRVDVAKGGFEHGPASLEQRPDALGIDAVLGEQRRERNHPRRSEVLRGELVVVEDDVFGYAEQTEHDRGDDAGAILARDAVEQQRALRRLDGAVEDDPDLRGEPIDEIDVDE